jgi:DNA-directed RNA polymerase omega subunit
MSNDLLPADVPTAPAETPEPIHSRFLFVDVAARRAIQLKRGARVRIPQGEHDRSPHKLERIAMEEVRQRLVNYQTPATL